MAAEKTMRLSQLARKLNVGTTRIVEFLADKGFEVENKPNSKVSGDQVVLLKKEFSDSLQDKEEASELTIGSKTQNVVIKSDNDQKVEEKKEQPKPEPKKKEPETITGTGNKLGGLKVLGNISLNAKGEPVAKTKKEEPKPKPIKEEPKVAPKPEKVEAKKEEKPVVKEEPKVKEKEVKKEEPKAVDTPEKKVPRKIELPPRDSKKKPFKQKQQTPTTKATKVEAKDAAPKKAEAKVEKKVEKVEKPEAKDQVIRAKSDDLKGLTVLGKIELPKDVKKGPGNKDGEKKKRKRVRIDRPVDVNKAGKKFHKKGGQRGNFKKPVENKEEISQKDIQDKIKATMAKLSGGGGKKGGNRAKYKKEKRNQHADQREEERLQEEAASKVLKCTEFVSASDLAALMNVSINDIISKCMMLGMIVSINQRLDAETITIIADEFGYEVQFTSSEEESDSALDEIEDAEEDLQHRAPIVTVMGHVDHGKTSLLDYIREAKVAAGEAGGITQHIGAYSVKTETGQKISFLDTPGHEAFTAMRARGAKLTDIVILVVAADDRVMPQTKEAINHAQVAGVPIIVAINKVDKDTANPDKIREELANENVLVEDWGGKYQCQEVSAKTGQGIDDLLEKVLLEAEVLELKANPDRSAVGTIVEASLDKGRGYVTNILVQTGTLKIGDIVVAGANHGKVKAMLDHNGKRQKSAGPSTPLQILGMDGAPQAGDRFTVAETEKEAKDICNKRAQILREQSVRTKKHLTIEEIGRRLAIGNFKELNVIIKGDVDGSVEALTDSLQKLSTEEVQVNVIHKAVGQITESDVLLATASDAIIIGFQVRPSATAKRLAEEEEIEIRHYSIIYKAIEEIKDALEGLLEPDTEEVITGNIEIRDIFKISKVGTVAGCYVTDGYVKRNNKIRLIREGVVKYEGEIGALKRFKDDVSEVKYGYECGLSIKNYNDLEIGDVVESYEIREIKRKLK